MKLKDKKSSLVGGKGMNPKEIEKFFWPLSLGQKRAVVGYLVQHWAETQDLEKIRHMEDEEGELFWYLDVRRECVEEGVDVLEKFYGKLDEEDVALWEGVKEVEETFDALSLNGKRVLLTQLLELWEDAVDIHDALEARKEGRYVDYEEIRKRYPFLDSLDSDETCI